MTAPADAGSPRLLLAGAGIMGRPYIAAGQAAGCTVCLLDSAENLRETRSLLRPGTDLGVAVGGPAGEHYLAAAMAVVANTRIDAVWPFGEFQVVPAAVVADKLGLPGSGTVAAVASRNKAYQRALFASAGVEQPEHRLVRVEDLPDAPPAAWDGYVLKPIDGTGSDEVIVGEDYSEVLGAARERGLGGTRLLEQYVPGPEFSFEALVHEGRIVFSSATEKVTTPPPLAVELEHRVPSGLPERSEAALERAAGRVVDALEVGNAIICMEAKVGPGARVSVLEVAVRMPGDYVMEVIRLARGVDLFAGGIALALGQRPVVEAAATPRVAASWLPTAPAGVVTSVDGVDAVRSTEGVELVRVNVEAGDEVAPLTSSAQRLGAVVVHAADRSALLDRLALVKSQLRVQVKPSP